MIPGVYIPVPPLAWEGDDDARRSGGEASPSSQGSAQRSDRPEGATPRLGLPSISDTPTITELFATLKEIRDRKQNSTPSKIAWSSFKRASVQAKAKYHNLFVDFCRYMDRCENSGFHAKGIAPLGNNSGLREISGPLCNRWHPDRRTKWIAKLYELAEWYKTTMPGCTMISLTGYQENSGMSFYDTWDNINESRVKLLKICRKYLGNIDYIWVVEPHTKNETGYPHYHLVIFKSVSNETKDSNGEGLEDKLRRLYSEEWKTGSHTFGLDFKVLEGDKGIENLKNYLLKYISKGYVTDAGWSTGELIFNAHLFGATHGYLPAKNASRINAKGESTKVYRLIGMSKHLSRLLKAEPQEEKEIIVWLHVDETEPNDITTETGEIIEDFTVKVMYDRLFIPDFIDTWRPLKKYSAFSQVKFGKQEDPPEKIDEEIYREMRRQRK